MRWNSRGMMHGGASKVQSGVEVEGGNKLQRMCPYQVLNPPNNEAQNLFSFILFNWKNENLQNQIRAKSSAG